MDLNIPEILLKTNELNCDSIIQFCEKHYEYLNKGTSRKVYDMGNGYVIKVAFNKNGIYQNRAEVRLYNQFSNNDVLLPIENSTDLWVIQKKVTPINSKNVGLFEELYNISFNKLCALIKYICQQIKMGNKCEYFFKDSCIFIYSIEKFLIESKSTFFLDYCKMDSWGYLDNKLYLIDYGMDNETYNKYIGKC